MQFGFIFVLIISIIISIFAIQNGDTVTIDLFFANFQVSQALVILVSTAVGAVVAAILGTIKQVKDFTSLKELKNKLKVAEVENTNINSNVQKYEENIKSLTEENSKLKDDIVKLNEMYQNKCNEANISQQGTEIEEICSDGSELNNSENAYLEESKNDEKNQTTN